MNIKNILLITLMLGAAHVQRTQAMELVGPEETSLITDNPPTREMTEDEKIDRYGHPSKSTFKRTPMQNYHRVRDYIFGAPKI